MHMQTVARLVKQSTWSITYTHRILRIRWMHALIIASGKQKVHILRQLDASLTVIKIGNGQVE